ncbi:MAG TPA: dephospho-CoA kinase [Burkholderiales bacterium]|nr:dephospho-CoA kinase [Burkholderiales bacterium]
MNRSLIVGLTGGIGSGKSSVSAQFEQLGAPVVDTDKIAHALTAPNGAAMPGIVDVFGTEFRNEDGSLNRPRMRDLIFSDDEARVKLENILHPMIYQEAVRMISLHSEASYIVLVVPLLFETGTYLPLIDRVLVVDCEEAQQISRTMKRSRLDETAVRRIMNRQMSRSERLRHADDMILNHDQLEFTRRQIMELDRLYNQLYRLGSEKYLEYSDAVVHLPEVEQKKREPYNKKVDK